MIELVICSTQLLKLQPGMNDDRALKFKVEHPQSASDLIILAKKKTDFPCGQAFWCGCWGVSYKDYRNWACTQTSSSPAKCGTTQYRHGK